jgi:hypothetical protein
MRRQLLTNQVISEVNRHKEELRKDLDIGTRKRDDEGEILKKIRNIQ